MNAIVTKSVSRFGRNTVDTLTYTRELKSLGVDVYFEKENIHTNSTEGELLLTLMAAFAESESYNMSENVKWGKRRRYEKGLVESINLCTIMGYKKVNGEIVLDDAEAAIVRKIYDYFLAGYGYTVIADRLKAEGVPTKKPGSMWASTTVRKILLNEKYCGNCLFQRTFIEDPISKKAVFNRGQLPQYLVEDALPVIIPKDEWQAAQELMNRHEMHQRGQCED